LSLWRHSSNASISLDVEDSTESTGKSLTSEKEPSAKKMKAEFAEESETKRFGTAVSELVTESRSDKNS